MADPLPRLCGISPVRGTLKTHPEDFYVEEIPAYAPSGQGGHLFVHIEKRGLTTRQAIERLARACGADARHAGSAGMKDRHAVTRQWLSFESADPARLAEAEDDQLTILTTASNETKLRTGHLQGNRFRLRVRDVEAAAIGPTVEAAARLAEGVPNYFGSQRFGREGNNVETARRWLVEGGRAPRARFKRKLMVSSLQSGAFNEVLRRRVLAGTVHAPMAGDVMQTVRRGLFTDDDLALLQERLDRWEISPTGPMFGSDMRRPTSDAETLEAEIEATFGFNAEVYGRMGKLGRGTRRVLRIRPLDLHCQAEEDGFTIAFQLPPGAYATVVMRELLAEPSKVTPQSDSNTIANDLQ